MAEEDSANNLVSLKAKMEEVSGTHENAFARALHKKIAEEVDRAIEEAGEAEEAEMGVNDEEEEEGDGPAEPYPRSDSHRPK